MLTYLREAEALAAALDDPRRQGQVSLFLSQYLRMMGLHDQATTAAQRALELATASGDDVMHAWTSQYLGLAYHVQGDYRRAIDCLKQAIVALEDAHALTERALAFACAHQERSNEAYALRLLGEIAMARALPAEADVHYRQALALADGLGMRPLQVHCHLALGRLYSKTGQPELAWVELSGRSTSTVPWT